MTQYELDCEVARATGESLKTIAALGFTALRPVLDEHEPDRPPLVMDWDEHDRRRLVVP